MKFRLADMKIHWSGVDSRTPDGHCLADGTDSLGNSRTWLFRGPEPSDDGYIGNILWPPRADILRPGSSGLRLIAYGRVGGYMRSGTNSGELLAYLARAASEETENTR